MASTVEPSGTSGPPFRYRPLKRQPQEIRLLRWSGSYSTFKPHNVSLDNLPPYIALSYHWGSSTPRRSITCNGARAVIPENLMTALETVYCAVHKEATELWEKNEDIYLWTDGLCINQEDVEE